MAPKITNETLPPPAVEPSEPHTAAATVTAAVGRLGQDDVRTRVDLVTRFGEAVSRFTGIFDALDSMFQHPPTNTGDICGGIPRFADRASDAVANFTKRLEGDVDIGPCDMNPDEPYYRILADWALHTKAIDQELYAEVTHINGRESELPDFSDETIPGNDTAIC